MAQKRYPMTIAEVQDCVLNILAVVIDICEAANIEYCLIGGGCLGIVRHQNSFVPWDDDLDIAIFAEDMQQFITAMKSLPQHYRLCCKKQPLNPTYKVCDTRTEIVSHKNFEKDEGSGVFIDIIPMMVWPSKTLKEVDIFLSRLCKREKSQSPVSWKRKIGNLLCYSQLSKLMLLFYENTFSSIFSRLSLCLRKSKKGILSGPTGRIWKGKYPWKVIFPLQDSNLNGIRVKVPSHLEDFLILRYGKAYNTIPKPSERWIHFDKAYRLLDQ